MRLFLDTNVVLDVFANRQPWADDSTAVLALIERGEADGFIAAHTVTTLHYLFAKHLGRDQAAAVLLDLLSLVHAVGVDHEVLIKAASLGWPDFEDAVQAICALEIEADHLVTRDQQSFKPLTISVVTPSELLGIVRSASS